MKEVNNIVGHVLQNMNEVVSNNYDTNHKALDIVSSNHTQSDIIALESGIVETVVKNVKTTNHNTKGLDTYGNYIKIKQTNGKTALYAHMKYGSVNANVGDFVEKGTIIGTMGATGNAYGNHLHLEIRNENGVKENPLISLKESATNENNNEENLNQSKIEEDIKNEDENNITNYYIENQNDNIENNSKKEATIITNSQSNLNDQKIEYLDNQNYKYGSIVDALKEINIDSSYQYRKKLATENGITNYHGSYNQNVTLLKLLKTGNLKKPKL